MNLLMKEAVEGYTVKTIQEIGYDDEVEIVGFSMEDLQKYTQKIIEICADMVKDPNDRQLILNTLRK